MLTEWVAVVEGQSRAADDVPGVEVMRAPAVGDDAIVEATERAVREGRAVTVVTSDRGLAERVTDAAAVVRGARWLLDLLEG